MAVTLSILAFVVVLGLLIGTFLNVCITRLPLGESVVMPRSHCRTCGQPVRWYDNVPAISYFFLRGRCRFCHATIGWRYPAVELATALWCAISFVPVAHLLSAHAPGDLVLSESIDSIALASLGALLLGLMVIDWQQHMLPDALSLPGIFVGLVCIGSEAILLPDGTYDLLLKKQVHLNAANSGQSPGNIFLTGPEHLVFGRLRAVIAAFLLLYLIGRVYKTIRKRDGMGLGDAKLLAMVAGFLGFAPAILAFFLGTLFATVYAVILLGRGRASATTRLPFGSFLCIGALLAALAGTRMVESYLALFR